MMRALATHLMTAVPLDPGADQARDQLSQELAKQEYQEAKPSWLDEFAKHFLDWLQQLFSAKASPFGVPNFAVTWIVIALIVVVVLVVVFGRPRAIARRAGQASAASVFLNDDTRTARELRAAAERAASAGDWSLAVAERFRAIARDLSDRTIIALQPGNTAQTVASRAAETFPQHTAQLRRAANAFDAVRYLQSSATSDDYARLAGLDHELAHSQPARQPLLSELRA